MVVNIGAKLKCELISERPDTSRAVRVSSAAGCLPHLTYVVQRHPTKRRLGYLNSLNLTFSGRQQESRLQIYAFQLQRQRVRVSIFASWILRVLLTASPLALFCSKEGSPQVKLKLGLVDNDAGHTFLFIGPQANIERETFKKELTNIIGANRAVGATQASTSTTNAQQTSIWSTASTSRPLPVSSRATSVSSNDHSSFTPIGGPTEDFRIRKKVLLKDTELAALHKELVMSGQITETEFWDGREVRCFCRIHCFLVTVSPFSASSPRGGCPRESEEGQAGPNR